MNSSIPDSNHPEATRSIWVFTPSRTSPEDLETILVQRHDLLKDAVERVRESALTDHKHHLLFVGPRGCGKTHLVTLIVSRISTDAEAAQHLRLAWLNEDETCTSLLELLLKVHSALEKRHPGEFGAEDLSGAYELKPALALDFVTKRLLDSLGSKTLVIVTENLDALFESLGEAGQKQLRAFIQEHPQFAFVATAQRLVEDLADRSSPFFGFFQTEHLKPLTVDQATTLLQNIARLQKKPEVTEFLATSRGRSRVRALHHLSGGNHRIYIVLSQFITRETMDALIGPFLKMVDELTPYYQERVRWLPPLQRKIVEMLCSCETTVPVKEIARKLFSTPQTISSQLQDLREKGYVEASQRGRESLYEISEPLMRICVEVKENQNTQPLRLLVDFLRVWYDDVELKRRLGLCQPESTSHGYLSAALERNDKEGNLRMKMLVEEVLGTELVGLDANGLKELGVSFPEELLIALQCQKDGDLEGAFECLEQALDSATTALTKANILLFRGLLHSQQDDSAAALADYTQVIDLHGTAPDYVAQALFYRGVMRGQQGDSAAAIADYTSVIELPGTPPVQVAQALFYRGVMRGQQGDSAAAIADYTSVIELPGTPPAQVAQALFNRGVMRGQQGDSAAAIADYTSVIELPGTPPVQVAQALFNRGVRRGQQGDSAAAIADYARVIELPGAPPDQVAKALLNRGVKHGQQGDLTAEIADYAHAINLPNSPPEQVAQALFYRGITHGQQGDSAAEIADYTQVIKLPGAPPDQVAQALFNRGCRRGQQGDNAAAIADYTRVIELPGAPPDQVAQALVNRGVTHGRQDDSTAAIADYTRVIALPGAAPDQMATAFFNRAARHFQAGQKDTAQADLEALITLENVSPENTLDAHLLLGELHLSEGRWSEGFAAIEAGLSLGAKQSPGYFEAPVDIIGVLFSAGLSQEGRSTHAGTLCSHYTRHSATAVLGEALVKHLGRLFVQGEPWPASDNLDQWSTAWEQAAAGAPEFKLPLRLLRTGIEFIKSGGKDPGVLLNLTSPERSILRQALGLEKTED